MKIETKVLEEAVKTAAAITGAAEVQFICHKHLYVASAHEGKYVKIVVARDVKGKWRGRILAGVLIDMIKRSTEVDLDMPTSGELKVHVRNTRGSIKCMPFEDLPKIEHKSGVTVKDKVQMELLTALSELNLADLYEDGNTGFLYVNLHKGRLAVSRFDTYHMAYLEVQKIKGELDIVASIESFDVISRLAGKNSYNLSMEDSVCAWNDWFEVQLPLVQKANDQTIGRVRELVMDTLKGKAGEIKVNREDFLAGLENCAAVHETGSSVKLVAKGDRAELSIKTGYGKAQTRLKAKVKKSIDVQLDPALVLDTLRPTKDKELRICFDDALAFVRCKEEDKVRVYAFVLIKT